MVPTCIKLVGPKSFMNVILNFNKSFKQFRFRERSLVIHFYKANIPLIPKPGRMYAHT